MMILNVHVASMNLSVNALWIFKNGTPTGARHPWASTCNTTPHQRLSTRISMSHDSADLRQTRQSPVVNFSQSFVHCIRLCPRVFLVFCHHRKLHRADMHEEMIKLKVCYYLGECLPSFISLPCLCVWIVFQSHCWSVKQEWSRDLQWNTQPKRLSYPSYSIGGRRIGNGQRELDHKA